MTLNALDLTELQSLLRFSVLCKYLVYDRKVLQKQVNICSLYQLKRQECAAVNPFPVMNCSEQCPHTACSETLKVLRKYYKKWINNPDSAGGLQCSANRGNTTKSDCTAAGGSPSCCWDKEQGRIWPGSHSDSPAGTWEKETPRFCLYNFWFEKQTILKTWLVPKWIDLCV